MKIMSVVTAMKSTAADADEVKKAIETFKMIDLDKLAEIEAVSDKQKAFAADLRESKKARAYQVLADFAAKAEHTALDLDKAKVALTILTASAASKIIDYCKAY